MMAGSGEEHTAEADSGQLKGNEFQALSTIYKEKMLTMKEIHEKRRRDKGGKEGLATANKAVTVDNAL